MNKPRQLGKKVELTFPSSGQGSYLHAFKTGEALKSISQGIIQSSQFNNRIHMPNKSKFIKMNLDYYGNMSFLVKSQQ